MSETYQGRYCSRFYCDKARERRCCADCPEHTKRRCRNPCTNHPARCGLKGDPPKRGKASC